MISQLITKLREQYESSCVSCSLVDSLISVTVLGLENVDIFQGKFKPKFVRTIVKEFWLMGQVTFDYFVDNEHYNIYKPELIFIQPIPGRIHPNVFYGETNITDQTVFMRRSINPYDFMGTSALISYNVLDTDPYECFCMAFSNATSLRNVVTGKIG